MTPGSSPWTAFPYSCRPYRWPRGARVASAHPATFQGCPARQATPPFRSRQPLTALPRLVKGKCGPLWACQVSGRVRARSRGRPRTEGSWRTTWFQQLPLVQRIKSGHTRCVAYLAHRPGAGRIGAVSLNPLRADRPPRLDARPLHAQTRAMSALTSVLAHSDTKEDMPCPGSN